jgi:glycosyltransferase involved in cell wall biosynthesis
MPRHRRRFPLAGSGLRCIVADMDIPRVEGSVVAADEGRRSGATVEVVLPVYNEEGVLESSVRKLDRFMASHLPSSTMITIVDSNSTDLTWELAQRLRDELPRVNAVQLGRSGKGLAVRAAWTRSQAEVVAYMDVDLSTDLSALPPLIAPLLTGHSDLAVATRLSRTSTVMRGPKRELISRAYNLLLRMAFSVGFSDAQCGFKAMRAVLVPQLLPLVKDDAWFFDSELLVVAERAGMRIFEVPVDWVDDPDSRVNLISASLVDLRGILRIGRAITNGRLELPPAPDRKAADEIDSRGGFLRFLLNGSITTLLYLVLFLAFRSFVGPQLSNLIAFLISALVRRASRGSSGRLSAGSRPMTPARGTLAFLAGLAVTAGSLGGLQLLVPDPPLAWELGALTAAGVVTMLIRFILGRTGLRPSRQTETA